MKFELIIDPSAEEKVTVTAHAEGPLTEKIRALAEESIAPTHLTAYTENDIKRLPLDEVECIYTMDGKTYLVGKGGETFRIKEKLFELEERLPSFFIRINKSAIANERRLERFRATLGGGVDAVFESGYKEYVSRRCFAEIKRRYANK